MEVPSFWTLADVDEFEAAIMEEKKLDLASCILPASTLGATGVLSISPTVISSSTGALLATGSTLSRASFLRLGSRFTTTDAEEFPRFSAVLANCCWYFLCMSS